MREEEKEVRLKGIKHGVKRMGAEKKKEQEKKALRRRGGKDKAKEVQISILGK